MNDVSAPSAGYCLGLEIGLLMLEYSHMGGVKCSPIPGSPAPLEHISKGSDWGEGEIA